LCGSAPFFSPYSPECVEVEFSEVRDYKLAPIWVRQLHTTVLKVPPARSKDYLATVVARIRYNALRLATAQLPENFSKRTDRLSRIHSEFIAMS
jgi:hypothetical protein